MGKKARVHRDLEVYQKVFDAAMRLFELSEGFPKAETYSLARQAHKISEASSGCNEFL